MNIEFRELINKIEKKIFRFCSTIKKYLFRFFLKMLFKSLLCSALLFQHMPATHSQLLQLKPSNLSTKSIFSRRLTTKVGHPHQSKFSALKEEKLLKYMLKDYNSNVIPKINKSHSFTIFFGLALVQLINIVSERNF